MKDTMPEEDRVYTDLNDFSDFGLNHLIWLVPWLLSCWGLYELIFH